LAGRGATPGRPWSGRQASLALAACFTVLGFLLVTASSSHRATARAAAPRRAQLVELIETRRDQVGELDRTVRGLRTEVEAAQAVALRRSRLDKDQSNREADLALQAGTTALRGPGLLVQLSDSNREPGGAPGEDGGAYRIQDSDIRLVVNALLDAGAEAVAVNESRLVATSPIRAAGDTIVVNFRPLTPPYRVTAIGADEDRFAESDIARRFKRWTKLFGLGFSLKQQAVTVPPYTGRVGISVAAPVGPTTTTTAPPPTTSPPTTAAPATTTTTKKG
jgi:uncharacterized protein YlxW (UPF0749 family)